MPKAEALPTALEQEKEKATIVVVEVSCDGHTGLGYTYCDPSAAAVVQDKLAGLLDGADPMSPERTWARAQVQTRQLGHDGIAAMAISAVDVALWDLRARQLGVPMLDLLGRGRAAAPVYGSGGFTTYDDETTVAQLREWLKTLRKKNARVVFATQSLADIENSAIAPAIIESCPTRVFLPNERAIEPQITAIYRRFGLNDRQIEILARAIPKRDYYCQSRRGNRLFEVRAPGFRQQQVLSEIMKAG